MLTDHFDDLESLLLLSNGKYEQMSNLLLFGIIMGFSSLVFGIVILIYTFDYLSIPSYSFIPMAFLFVISFSIIVIIICMIKYSVLNKVINKELLIDQQMLKLIVHQKEFNERNRKEWIELIDQEKISPDFVKQQDNYH